MKTNLYCWLVVAAKEETLTTAAITKNQHRQQQQWQLRNNTAFKDWFSRQFPVDFWTLQLVWQSGTNFFFFFWPFFFPLVKKKQRDEKEGEEDEEEGEEEEEEEEWEMGIEGRKKKLKTSKKCGFGV